MSHCLHLSCEWLDSYLILRDCYIWIVDTFLGLTVNSTGLITKTKYSAILPLMYASLHVVSNPSHNKFCVILQLF